MSVSVSVCVLCHNTRASHVCVRVSAFMLTQHILLIPHLPDLHSLPSVGLQTKILIEAAFRSPSLFPLYSLSSLSPLSPLLPLSSSLAHYCVVRNCEHQCTQCVVRGVLTSVSQLARVCVRLRDISRSNQSRLD